MHRLVFLTVLLGGGAVQAQQKPAADLTGGPPAIEAVRGPTAPAILGAGWTLAAESEYSSFWARTERATRSGSLVTIWVATTAHEGLEREFQRSYEPLLGADRARVFERAAMRYEVDCAGERTRTVQIVYYDVSGHPMDTLSRPNAGWQHPPPNSVHEALVEHVCLAVR